MGLSVVVYLTAFHTLFATDKHHSLSRDISTESITSSQAEQDHFNWVMVSKSEMQKVDEFFLGDNMSCETQSPEDDQANGSELEHDLNESPTSSLCLSSSSSLNVSLGESDEHDHRLNSTPYSHLNDDLCDMPEADASIRIRNHFMIPTPQVQHDRPPLRIPFDCHSAALTPSLRQFNQMRSDQQMQHCTKTLDELERQTPAPEPVPEQPMPERVGEHLKGAVQLNPLDITSHSNVDNSLHPLLRPSSPNTAANFYCNNITLGEDGIPRFSELPGSQTPGNQVQGRDFFNTISKSPGFWAFSLTAGALLLFANKET